MKFKLKCLFQGLIAVTLLSACAVKPAVLSGFEDRPSAIGLQIIDTRAESDKKSDSFSSFIGSCTYGIYKYSDDEISPAKLILLRQDLEEALGSQLANSTIEVSKYDVFMNRAAKLLSGTAAFGGSLVVGAFRPDCTREETGGGWFAREELDSPARPSPIIVEIEVAYKGKTYDARAVVGTDLGAGPQTAPPEIFDALRKANAALAEKLRQKQ